MKSLYITLLLVLTLSVSGIAQSTSKPKHGFSFRYLWYNYVNPSPAWDNWTDVYSDWQGNGVELAYNRHLNDGYFLVVPLKAGIITYAPGVAFGDQRRLTGHADVLIQKNMFKYGNFINPVLQLGLGTTRDLDGKRWDFNIPAALGFNIRIGDGFYITTTTQYRFSMENRPGWHHGLGLQFYFGGEPEAPKVTDRDGDGIPDDMDKCPDMAGPATTMGCPDRDGDGIADMDDMCPDQPGPVATKGCPDTDGDGIPDKDDDCPREAGPIALKGCPDRDGDGIADKDDRCPDQPGTAALRGCPDRDGDGIADIDDRCPDQRGTAALKGCPDRDGDGIADIDDLCPDQPGPASNKGCPEMTKEDKEKVDLAVRMVQFETGKATLLKSSNKVLDDVAAVLLKYDYYNLAIEGHTDDVGDDRRNQVLSEQRAKTCFDYLVSKGVSAARMTHAGFGETRPVADNKTAQGRALNRRVEFNLKLKE
ncbi:MAG: OmpA family protein [Saprospiraceae bacterium]